MNTELQAEIESKLQGDFDALTVVELRPLFDQLAKSAESDLLLNISGIDFMDSSGIGALVFLFKRLRNRGLKLALLGAKGQPLELIQYLRVDRSIPLRTA